MTTPTQRLIDRDIRSRQEVRRGTVLSDPSPLNYDTAAIDRTVFVVDVDIGATRPIRNVIVKSSSGLGGRAYAQVGKAIEIQRNQGGRWFAIGAGDRIRNTALIEELDESTDVFGSPISDGFTFARRTYTYYRDNNVYGTKGYGNAVVVDSAGNEVNL